MEGLRIFLAVLLVVSCSPDRISGSVSEVSVRPGDNITLYCDCRSSSAEFIVWYRNCSHENQPSLVLKSLNEDKWKQNTVTGGFLNPIPRFHLVKNFSSSSYDLLIRDVTESDGGLYYCGTEQRKLEDKEFISLRFIYRYGNVTTRIIFNSSNTTTEDCGVCWKLLFSLCPALAVLSSVLSSILVYHFCQKTAQIDEKRHDTRGQPRVEEDEDVCYAAVEIRPTSQRPKKKQIQSYATYSAIKTYKM